MSLSAQLPEPWRKGATQCGHSETTIQSVEHPACTTPLAMQHYSICLTTARETKTNMQSVEFHNDNRRQTLQKAMHGGVYCHASKACKSTTASTKSALHPTLRLRINVQQKPSPPVVCLSIGERSKTGCIELTKSHSGSSQHLQIYWGRCADSLSLLP